MATRSSLVRVDDETLQALKRQAKERQTSITKTIRNITLQEDQFTANMDRFFWYRRKK